MESRLANIQISFICNKIISLRNEVTRDVIISVSTLYGRRIKSEIL